MVPSARRRSWMCVATLIAACTFGGSAYGRTAEATTHAPSWPARAWVASWSMTPVPGMTGFTDRTLREIVHLGMGADHVRTRLTNIFGTDGVAVDGVRAGLRASGSWYLLDGLDVRAAPQARAVVALGGSLTGGTASTVDANRRYTDNLARRIGGRNLSVLNQGASGNRLLTDASGSGVSVQVRFDRDVVAQTGVRTVILAEGIHAFDGVADFDAAVRDPLDPARFLPAYDSGDHLHPDDAGYQAMADVVDLRRL